MQIPAQLDQELHMDTTTPLATNRYGNIKTAPRIGKRAIISPKVICSQ